MKEKKPSWLKNQKVAPKEPGQKNEGLRNLNQIRPDVLKNQNEVNKWKKAGNKKSSNLLTKLLSRK
jgi:hypothetical protein